MIDGVICFAQFGPRRAHTLIYQKIELIVRNIFCERRHDCTEKREAKKWFVDFWFCTQKVEETFLERKKRANKLD